MICYEFKKRGLNYKRQQGIEVIDDDVKPDMGFRAGIIVENKVIVEVKSVETLAPVHYKQLLTYLKLTDIKVGLPANFNVNLMKQGIVRLVNNL